MNLGTSLLNSNSKGVALELPMLLLFMDVGQYFICLVKKTCLVLVRIKQLNN